MESEGPNTQTNVRVPRTNGAGRSFLAPYPLDLALSYTFLANSGCGKPAHLPHNWVLFFIQVQYSNVYTNAEVGRKIEELFPVQTVGCTWDKGPRDELDHVYWNIAIVIPFGVDYSQFEVRAGMLSQRLQRSPSDLSSPGLPYHPAHRLGPRGRHSSYSVRRLRGSPSPSAIISSICLIRSF